MRVCVASDLVVGWGPGTCVSIPLLCRRCRRTASPTHLHVHHLPWALVEESGARSLPEWLDHGPVRHGASHLGCPGLLVENSQDGGAGSRGRAICCGQGGYIGFVRRVVVWYCSWRSVHPWQPQKLPCLLSVSLQSSRQRSRECKNPRQRWLVFCLSGHGEVLSVCARPRTLPAGFGGGSRVSV